MILVTNLKSVSESYTATRWAKQNIIKFPHTETTDGAMQRAKRETHSDQGRVIKGQSKIREEIPKFITDQGHQSGS